MINQLKAQQQTQKIVQQQQQQIVQQQTLQQTSIRHEMTQKLQQLQHQQQQRLQQQQIDAIMMKKGAAFQLMKKLHETDPKIAPYPPFLEPDRVFDSNEILFESLGVGQKIVPVFEGVRFTLKSIAKGVKEYISKDGLLTFKRNPRAKEVKNFKLTKSGKEKSDIIKSQRRENAMEFPEEVQPSKQGTVLLEDNMGQGDCLSLSVQQGLAHDNLVEISTVQQGIYLEQHNNIMEKGENLMQESILALTRTLHRPITVHQNDQDPQTYGADENGNNIDIWYDGRSIISLNFFKSFMGETNSVN